MEKDAEVIFWMCRYITLDELVTAFKENNMGDDAKIKELLSDIDSNKVSWF